MVRKIRSWSWVKDGGFVDKICEHAENGLMSGAKAVLPAGEKSDDKKKETKEGEKSKTDKAKEPAEQEETGVNLEEEDMKWIQSQIPEMKEDDLLSKIMNAEMSKIKSWGNEMEEAQFLQKVDKEVEDNHVPQVTSNNYTNLLLFNSAKNILDQARDEGITDVTESDDRNRPLSEIYEELNQKNQLREQTEKVAKQIREQKGNDFQRKLKDSMKDIPYIDEEK